MNKIEKLIIGIIFIITLVLTIKTAYNLNKFRIESEKLIGSLNK